MGVTTTSHHDTNGSSRPNAVVLAPFSVQIGSFPRMGFRHVGSQARLNLGLEPWFVVEQLGRGHPETELRIDIRRPVLQRVEPRLEVPPDVVLAR